MLKIGWAVAVSAAIALGGCANTDRFGNGPKEGTGPVFGALSGALIGSTIGGTAGDRVAAAAAGAAIGGLIGNRIGAAMDDEDRRLAYQAQIEAFGTAILSGSAFRADGMDGLRAVEVASAVIGSQRTGERLAVQHAMR